MKKIFALAIVAAMIVSMASASFAGDYGDEPDYSGVTGGGSYGSVDGDQTTANGSTGTNAKEPASVVTSDFLKNIIRDESNPIIYVASGATMDVSTIKAISDSGKPVQFNIGRNLKVSLSNVQNAKAMRLGFDVDPKDNGEVAITPLMKGDFGCIMSVAFTDPAFEKMNPSTTKLYYKDSNGKLFDYGRVGIDKNMGTAKFNISHSSSYIITDKAMDAIPVTPSNPGTSVKPNPGTGAQV